mmetsp:Transcript_17760/g.49193  ORF Transcript_17760/g.49193 Transcript_17760/m.49193 type:complete len:94 (-) Transcript_17760:31-312(-)
MESIRKTRILGRKGSMNDNRPFHSYIYPRLDDSLWEQFWCHTTTLRFLKLTLKKLSRTTFTTHGRLDRTIDRIRIIRKRILDTLISIEIDSNM